MAMGGSGPGGTMSDINVTPLVDVMLVLLIIFMVTAPMMNTGVDVDLPREVAQPLSTDDDDQLVLTLDGTLTVYLQETAFGIDEIEPKLAAIAEANPDKPVFLRADGAVPYRYVAQVLASAKRAGMPRVGLVFDPMGEDAPEPDEE